MCGASFLAFSPCCTPLLLPHRQDLSWLLFCSVLYQTKGAKASGPRFPPALCREPSLRGKQPEGEPDPESPRGGVGVHGGAAALRLLQQLQSLRQIETAGEMGVTSWSPGRWLG